jgi:hypothetical protein
MSIDATRWAWQQQGLRPLQKLILLSLADRADTEMCAFPSCHQLHVDTGADRKTIIKAMHELQEIGLIADTGERVGATKQIVVWQLVGVPKREDEIDLQRSPKTEQFQKQNNSTFLAKSPIFPIKSPKSGTRNLSITYQEPNNTLLRGEDAQKSGQRGKRPATYNRQDRLCRQLHEAGIMDAASHRLALTDWRAILSKRTDEEILAFAKAKLSANPNKRISLAYLAPGLLEDPKPIKQFALRKGSCHETDSGSSQMSNFYSKYGHLLVNG